MLTFTNQSANRIPIKSQKNLIGVRLVQGNMRSRTIPIEK